MKILQSTIIRGISGSENFLLSIIPEFIKKGYKMDVLILYVDIDETISFQEKLNEINCNFHLVDINKSKLPFSLKKIANIMREYDIVNSHLLHSDFILSMSKALFSRNTKLYSAKHGYDETYTNKFGFNVNKSYWNLYRLISTLSERYIDKSFAVSQGVINLLTGLNIRNKKPIYLINLGFNFQEKIKENRDCKLSNNQLCIVGRLSEYKGHKYAIKAMTNVIKFIPDAKLVIIGSGNYQEELENYSKELGLTSNIIFKGHQINAREWMASSDIILVPSKAEGFGIVTAEAMSVKKPIIGFDVSATNEIIENEKSGYLIPPFDTDKMAEKIIYLLQNKEFAEKMGENAEMRLKTTFNFDKMISKLEDFYTY